MRLTVEGERVRSRVIGALLDIYLIAGRTDREAQVIFDNCSADLESAMIGDQPMEQMLGVYLVSPEEVDALDAFGDTFNELARLTNRGNELAWLSHPYYKEFAQVAKAAYDVMLSSEADQ